MEVLDPTATLVKCPHCGNRFSSEEAIGHDLKVRLEKQFQEEWQKKAQLMEARIRKQEQDRFALEIRLLEEERRAKGARVKELEEESLRIKARERDLRDKEERLEVDMNKKLLERERLIRELAERSAQEKAALQFQEQERKLAREREAMELMVRQKAAEAVERAREEEKLKAAELQKKLDDQVRLVNEMKRKSEQGSMQLQGEVQELALEEYLSRTFPRDEVAPVAKGKRGGDCLHVVRSDYHQVCGKILYESKRTKHFSHEWISKIKDDMRLEQADIAVIVTEALPDGVSRFTQIEGVWVCSFLDFKPLALIFRQQLLRVGEVVAAQENKGDKMSLLYRYIGGNEFRQKLEAAFESYREMQEDLARERALFSSHWAKREKRLLKAMENLVSLYGDVRGIAGGAVQEIRGLDLADTALLD